MKALIIGYYGSDNIGDEVLLSQTIRIMREIRPDMEIRSLSYCALKTQETHGIGTVGRNKYSSIVKAVLDSDIVVGGGGSIIQNVTSNRSLVYYLALIRISTLLKKKVVLLGNGFGPVKGGLYRHMTRKVLSGIDAFVARDGETLENLKSLGVGAKVELASDLSYYGYESSGGGRSRRVAINVRPWKNDSRIIGEMSKFTKRLVENGYQVEFLSMQKGKDEKLKEKIEECSGIEIPLIPNTVEGFLGGSADYCAMVGMRLHALIWAGLKDIPFVGIEYDPKIESYVNSANQLGVGGVEAIDSERLWEAFSELMDNYGEMKATLVENNLKMKEKADVNHALLKEVLEMAESQTE